LQPERNKESSDTSKKNIRFIQMVFNYKYDQLFQNHEILDYSQPVQVTHRAF
jgi:hypothetical protein